MATPVFLPPNFAGSIGFSKDTDRGSSSSTPQPANGTAAPPNTRRAASAGPPAVSSENTLAIAELDSLYDKLSTVSKTLSKMDPTLPAEEIEATEQEPITVTTREEDSAAPEETDAFGCGIKCACQRVLTKASPGACGLCGGRPEILATLHSQRTAALDDLDVATQRINELALEKARNADYIADLEARVAAQNKTIDEQRDVVAGLKNDLSAMNDKFVDQVNMTAEIAHSRELVEAELEDLTQKLFSEANEMVASEKKARFEAEKTSAHLRNVISDLETRLGSETMQSQELKERIEQMSAEYDEMVVRTAMQTSRRGSIGSHDSEAGISVREASAGPALAGIPGSAVSDGFRLAVHTAAIVSSARSISGSPVASAPVRIDDVLLGEFEEFAKLAQAPRSTTYLNTAFMKHVVSEDIEPCLRFGPHPRISSHNVLDAIVSNKLQIEEMTPQVAAEMRRQQLAVEKTSSNRQAMLWERFRGTVAVNPNGCQACGREAQCTYRFSMGQRDIEWIQVDSYCRDRLVAVCEFYGFVRYLRQGIYASRSTMDMFQETIHRRLCMFYARIGAYAYASDIDMSLVESVAMARNAQLAGYSPQQFAQ
ncbi:hypothetical protein FBU59_002708, partial [Linderina macrospora]